MVQAGERAWLVGSIALLGHGLYGVRGRPRLSAGGQRLGWVGACWLVRVEPCLLGVVLGCFEIFGDVFGCLEDITGYVGVGFMARGCSRCTTAC
jgi:hypothetical protein